MFRNAGISARLNLLAGLFVAATVALIVLGYSSIGGQTATQRRLVSLARTASAAQVVQYDFADFNGWQTAYSFDVTRDGRSAAADGASSRKAFLAAVERTRQDLATFDRLAAGEPVIDHSALGAVSQGLDKFMQLDDRIIGLYRSGSRTDRAVGDALVLKDEIAIYDAAAKNLASVVADLSAAQADAARMAAERGRSALWWNVGLGACGLLLVIGVSLLIAQSIRRPLSRLTHSADRLAVGDFAFEIGETRRDEAGRALASLDGCGPPWCPCWTRCPGCRPSTRRGTSTSVSTPVRSRAGTGTWPRA